jgi:hypothetical protein
MEPGKLPFLFDRLLLAQGTSSVHSLNGFLVLTDQWARRADGRMGCLGSRQAA